MGEVMETEKSPRPYWFPDAQGFVIFGILILCGSALYIRMFHGGLQDDKMLDTMITILFSTCLTGIVNYLFSSNRDSKDKNETIRALAVSQQAPPAPIPVVPPTNPPAAS